jgi:hypothetical protein
MSPALVAPLAADAHLGKVSAPVGQRFGIAAGRVILRRKTNGYET